MNFPISFIQSFRIWKNKAGGMWFLGYQAATLFKSMTSMLLQRIFYRYIAIESSTNCLSKISIHSAFEELEVPSCQIVGLITTQCWSKINWECVWRWHGQNGQGTMQRGRGKADWWQMLSAIVFIVFLKICLQKSERRYVPSNLSCLTGQT